MYAFNEIDTDNWIKPDCEEYNMFAYSNGDILQLYRKKGFSSEVGWYDNKTWENISDKYKAYPCIKIGDEWVVDGDEFVDVNDRDDVYILQFYNASLRWEMKLDNVCYDASEFTLDDLIPTGRNIHTENE